MTKRSTRFAIYTILALKGLMWYDAPVVAASAEVADGATAAAAAVACVPHRAATLDALAVKCREGAKEYRGPRFGVSGRALFLQGMRHA